MDYDEPDHVAASKAKTGLRALTDADEQLKLADDLAAAATKRIRCPDAGCLQCDGGLRHALASYREGRGK